MGKCSICQEEGHNKRTCKTNPQSLTNFIRQDKKEYSTSASQISEICQSPKSNNVKGKTETREYLPEKVRYHPDMEGNKHIPAGSGITSINSKIKSANHQRKELSKKENQLRDKIEKIPKTSSQLQHISNSCDGCNHAGFEENLRKCSHCKSQGHNIKTCPELETERQDKKERLERGAGSWLTSDAFSRFLKGPTEKDGPGYIYIYTYLEPKTGSDRNIFKIGMSEKEEGRTRIKVQETKNKEKYKTVFHETTPYRFLTESVIHTHLNDVRAPREQGDGKTEWFRGNRDSFERIVLNVIKEVRFAIVNELFTQSSVDVQ